MYFSSNSGNNGSINGNNNLVTITNPHVDVILPKLKYGYRTTKATWDELVQIIEIEYDIPKMSRSRIQQHDYEVFRYHMKQQYRSSLDFILISKFGFDAVSPNVNNKDNPRDNTSNSSSNNNNSNSNSNKSQPEQKWMAHPCLADIDNPKIILMENDFPYYLEDNIVHYVLWKIKEPITQQEIIDAREELQSEKIKALEILQWVNPPYLQSIPEIDHVHFLCRL
mmetsp:Transcript_5888/g.12789  ORF Transcript_5888/g.12789 Transcript_5888/m.12789 type:complete len:224 (+) Transcript_5888:72-743(+)